MILRNEKESISLDEQIRVFFLNKMIWSTAAIRIVVR